MIFFIFIFLHMLQDIPCAKRAAHALTEHFHLGTGPMTVDLQGEPGVAMNLYSACQVSLFSKQWQRRVLFPIAVSRELL